MKRVNSIRFKITAITVAAILFAIFFVFIASYPTLLAETDRRSVEMMQLIGKNTKDELDDYFASIEQSVRLADSMAIDSLDSVTLVECGAAGIYAEEHERSPEQMERLDAYIAEHCAQVLKTFATSASHTNGIVSYYYRIDQAISQAEHGFLYSRVGKAGFARQTLPHAWTTAPEGVPDDDWYATAVRCGRPTWVGPYRNDVLGGREVCSYLIPVYSTGTLIGVLGMDIPLDTLADHVSAVQVYETGFVSLIDSENRILYHPALRRGTSLSQAGLSVPQELLQHEESQDALIRYTIDGEERQMSFTTLRNGMRLVVTAPVKEINASWLQQARIILITSFVVIILSAGLVMLAMRIVTEPLLKLTAASQRLADEDYDVALNYQGKDEIGQLTQAFIRMRDRVEDSIADLNRQVNTDMLTGLPNMRCFFKLAAEERQRLAEQGKDSALLYFDLIGMKYYNRQYGFEAGDHVLCEVGQVLARHFGEMCLCRLSDDHFAAVSGADGLEERLQAVFDDCERLNGGMSLPVRVGIYYDSMEPVSVSIACDHAKYACSRHRGSFESGFYTFDEDMLSQLDGVRHIVNHLDQALAEHWIQVYYQPIIRGINGRACDIEALARWIDPARGMISPSFFIPVLEKARLIYKMDLYVLDRILEKMQGQEAAGIRVMPHSLNLSRSDFETCDIVEEIRRRVDAAGIGHDKLTIEVTESIIGSDFDFMKEQVRRFQALGFAVWMDDFGSGYSSLGVLQEIHFDLLKFDMRFLKQFAEGEESKIILTDLVRMANDLGIDTICEGVETAEEVAFLREIGCSKLQGYYFSKPIPYEEVLERRRKGIDIDLENPAETDYYAAIDRVNLNEIAMVSDEGAHKDFFDATPAGVMELGENEVCYVRTNRAYRQFMKEYYRFDLDSTQCGYPAWPSDAAGAFMDSVRQSCHDWRPVFFEGELPNGHLVHAIISPVEKNPVSGAAAVAVTLLSIKTP